MFTANITVICPYPCLFNFIWWHHASWLGTTHPWNPPRAGFTNRLHRLKLS